MTYTLDLPPTLRANGWRVKIRNLERVEVPHITVLHREREWRLSLRDWSELPYSERRTALDAELWAHLQQKHAELVAAWDAKYATVNPVWSVKP